jgi:hypothetical protein
LAQDGGRIWTKGPAFSDGRRGGLWCALRFGPEGSGFHPQAQTAVHTAGSEITKKRRRVKMEKIASFTIDHIRLQPGVYVSRKDQVGDQVITTFDLRMTSPNEEPVMNTAEMHTIEHLAATFLRNHKEYGSRTIYFGPMGCRTGFYLLLAGNLASREILPLMVELFAFIRDFEGEVPGASARDCGNYLDMNLGMAKYLAARYLKVLEQIDSYPESRLEYPQ